MKKKMKKKKMTTTIVNDATTYKAKIVKIQLMNKLSNMLRHYNFLAATIPRTH